MSGQNFSSWPLPCEINVIFQKQFVPTNFQLKVGFSFGQWMTLVNVLVYVTFFALAMLILTANTGSPKGKKNGSKMSLKSSCAFYIFAAEQNNFSFKILAPIIN